MKAYHFDVMPSSSFDDDKEYVYTQKTWGFFYFCILVFSAAFGIERAIKIELDLIEKIIGQSTQFFKDDILERRQTYWTIYIHVKLFKQNPCLFDINMCHECGL